MKLGKYLRAYANACRMEYIPGEAPGMAIPLLLGAASLSNVLAIHVIESFLVFILLFWSGFLINALADVEVDSKYKTFVSQAVSVLGKKMLKRLIFLQVMAGILITAHICYLLNNYWILIWIIVATFFGLGYSVEPFHFKVRGILHATLAFSAMFAPFIFLLYVVIGGMPSLPLIFITLALTIVHYGIALVNQSQDYLEDKETGLKTPAVRWGLTKTLKIALVLVIGGLCISIIGFYLLFSGLTPLAILGYSFNIEIILAFTVLILILTYSVPFRGLRDLIKISSTNANIKQTMNRIKSRLNYPKWQASGIMGLAILSILFFVIRTL